MQRQFLCFAWVLLCAVSLDGLENVAVASNSPTLGLNQVRGELSEQASPNEVAPTQANAPTLMDTQTPSDSELSRANTELLAKNAELSRQVDDLTTQVNVLTQERSGQLFLYGAMSVLISLIAGFVLAKLTNRQRW